MTEEKAVETVAPPRVAHDRDKRHPFCVAQGYMGEVVVFVGGGEHIGQGTFVIADTLHWAGNRVQVRPKGVTTDPKEKAPKATFIDRSFVFRDEIERARAMVWIQTLVHPLRDLQESDLGSGEFDTHEGRRVAVFVPDDPSYQTFGLGILDKTHPAHLVKGKDGRLDPDKSTVCVWFPWEETETETQMDSVVKLRDIYDPRLVTDPLGAWLAEMMIANWRETPLPKGAVELKPTPAKTLQVPKVRIEVPKPAVKAVVAKAKKVVSK